MTVDAFLFWGIPMPKREWDLKSEDYVFPGGIQDKYDLETWLKENPNEAANFPEDVTIVRLGDWNEPQSYLSLKSKVFEGDWETALDIVPSATIITDAERVALALAAKVFGADMTFAGWRLGAYGSEC